MRSVRFTKDKIPQTPFFKGGSQYPLVWDPPNSDLNYMFTPQHTSRINYHKTATCGGNHATSSTGGIDCERRMDMLVDPTEELQLAAILQ